MSDLRERAKELLNKTAFSWELYNDQKDAAAKIMADFAEKETADLREELDAAIETLQAIFEAYPEVKKAFYEGVDKANAREVRGE